MHPRTSATNLTAQVPRLKLQNIPTPMFILVGLPVDEDAPQPTEEQIQQEYGLCADRIFLPPFTGVSLEGIVNQVESLNSLEKSCESLLKTFIGYSGANKAVGTLGSIEAIRSMLRWDDRGFMTHSVDKAILLLDGEYGRISNAYAEKVDEFGEAKRECEGLQKLTRGSLCDISLSIIVDRPEKYEFLKVLYIVVQKGRMAEFERVVDESPHVSADAVEKVSSDDEYCLVKLYVLHHSEEDVRAMMHAAGFAIRDVDEAEISSEEITARRRRAEERFSSVERVLTTFVHVHLTEILKVLVHVKLLRLFVESVYRYGLPTEYVFFVTSGEKTKVLGQWTTIAKGWPSDRVVYEEDADNHDENEVFFAFSEIGTYDDEE